MKAIAVYPGKPNSMHLEDIPVPKISDIPGGRGVLVKVLRVGVDGPFDIIFEASGLSPLVFHLSQNKEAIKVYIEVAQSL